ncbi:hypothetical protein BH23ACT6_BH23ACT6_24680 [soil metagenome]
MPVSASRMEAGVPDVKIHTLAVPLHASCLPPRESLNSQANRGVRNRETKSLANGRYTPSHCVRDEC